MEKFEPHILLESCQKCVGLGSTIYTDHYLCIFSEITKLFTEWGLGAAFKDADKYVKKLEIQRVAGVGCNYREFQEMIQHEKDVQQTDGTTAFLALHDRLTFASNFLDALNTAVTEDRKFNAKKRLQTYKATLSEHQPSLTQSAVKVALLRSPGRRGLLAMLQNRCHGDMSAPEVLEDISHSLLRVHGIVDSVCCKHSL